MRLTEEQKLKVEANMGLVGKVIADWSIQILEQIRKF